MLNLARSMAALQLQHRYLTKPRPFARSGAEQV